MRILIYFYSIRFFGWSGIRKVNMQSSLYTMIVWNVLMCTPACNPPFKSEYYPVHCSLVSVLAYTIGIPVF